MYKIYFYKDKNGKSPVVEYMEELAKKRGKDSRIKMEKISDYIQALSIYGTKIGQPQVKHIEGDIWELRPLRDRIFFVAWNGDGFVLLHHFTKRTQKTPKREIEKAKRELEELRERGV